MKKIIVLLILLISAFYFSTQTLVVYTYDSFVSGIGYEVVPIFEKMYGCKVDLRSFGDAGSVLSRLILEKQNPKADVIIGLDQALLFRAIKENLLEKYTPINKSLLKYPELLNEYGVPYDFGAIAIVYNRNTVKNPPKSFSDLLSKKFKNRIVVQDPRTSSTGLSFLLWTIAVYKDNYLDFWKKFKENILTITPGWDEAFEMLESGEADIMVSYATDGAYSYHNYGEIIYVPVILDDGACVQIEYASIVKGTKNMELAKRFLEFILMEDFQEKVPLNQWMLPVTEVNTPEAFKYVPQINKILKLEPKIYEKQEEILKEWSKEVIGG
ncbi:ABC transporter substrate-binding protein [Thermosipho melanesiensis]|uniref:ABC transporter, periplasmic binding protein, thiB subfamily n=2 Tax=Thermosipho melanesiensis TaxID=46541 RepID=A6LNZ1_THEM4|nr:thiamine ABC transporter substrate-binding protein [Thermosipho melanesiensis]ABR31642.1 ABC transporter, periplasmic binding protein, thiB subfamily [Thermosipho melanesiensis BI429]APT74671.1 ABC transporter substrate-binding protein [Thermosipho melanesiensis]OOC35251.1 ABC transporter substrate-binding protein [Thermosipho melanesiensis]OOC35461.1 ABC transporter substrate-binding protein [Thermosipho melanesiensis]OOC36819.1 ABC transporter substrate-binding protein [Thermosipho melane